MRDKYRLDGSPYPEGDSGLLEWAQDMEDFSGRVVRQETLWNGVWLSTVWLGLDHSFGHGPPLIFEIMAFNHIVEEYIEPSPSFAIPGRWFQPALDIQERYSTLRDAEMGHEWWKFKCSSVSFTLGLWWNMIMADYFDVR